MAAIPRSSVASTSRSFSSRPPASPPRAEYAVGRRVVGLGDPVVVIVGFLHSVGPIAQVAGLRETHRRQVQPLALRTFVAVFAPEIVRESLPRGGEGVPRRAGPSALLRRMCRHG